MKKYPVILLMLLTAAPYVSAQTVKRTSQMPGFFIPQGALHTQPQAEKLVPVEEMRYQGRQAQIVIDLQRQKQEEARKKLEAEKREEEAVRRKTELAAAKAAESGKTQTASAPAAAQPAAGTAGIKSPAPQTATQTVVETKTPAIPAAPAAAPLPSKQDLAAMQTDDKMFAQIIDEYRRETAAISQGHPVRNQRLIDMIADYKDIDRKI